MYDEDEVLEIVEFGGRVSEQPVGLDYAEDRARSRFARGLIDVDEFEAEVARLIAKRDKFFARR